MTVARHVGPGVILTIDAALYGEDVVFKCFYWYADAYDVSIARSGCAFEVTLVPKAGSLTAEDEARLQARVAQDLIDFKTRDIVAKDTRVIRELLLAKALSPSDEVDSPPPGTVDRS